MRVTVYVSRCSASMESLRFCTDMEIPKKHTPSLEEAAMIQDVLKDFIDNGEEEFAIKTYSEDVIRGICYAVREKKIDSAKVVIVDCDMAEVEVSDEGLLAAPWPYDYFHFFKFDLD